MKSPLFWRALRSDRIWPAPQRGQLSSQQFSPLISQLQEKLPNVKVCSINQSISHASTDALFWSNFRISVKIDFFSANGSRFLSFHDFKSVFLDAKSRNCMRRQARFLHFWEVNVKIVSWKLFWCQALLCSFSPVYMEVLEFIQPTFNFFALRANSTSAHSVFCNWSDHSQRHGFHFFQESKTSVSTQFWCVCWRNVSSPFTLLFAVRG